MQQQPDNQKNILMAIVLSVAVLLGWQVFYANPKMERDQEHRKQLSESKKTTPGTQTVPGRPGAPSAPKAGAARPGAPTPAGGLPGSVPRPAGMTPAASRAIALKATPRIPIDTPSIIGSIALTGGRIDDITLKKYRETIDPKSPPVVLFSPASSANPYFAEFGWVAAADSNVKLPDDKTVWNARGVKKMGANQPLKLTWDNGQGLIFTRTITVDENYLFTVRDEVKNTSSSRVMLHPYARIQRDGTPKVQGFFILHEGLIGVLGEKSLIELDYDDAVEDDSKPLEFKDTTGGWLGMTDKYWAAVLIPDQKAPYQGRLLGVPKKDARLEYFQTDYLRDAISIPAGGAATVTGHLFAGAKKFDIVEAYEAKHGILKFDLMIDWGWFYFITKPLFRLLQWLYGMVGNFGIAIMIATVMVKLAFFPLANKSYVSMSKMKKLQPEMTDLRERFKDDKGRQQQALMELYKKEKINPMSGCLPILLQIPVFFALYKVLFVTIDMRQAPFFGWIQDLSSPDPTTIFNLFGLIPWQPPEFLLIGVWPLLMGMTMWVQMQLNPQQPDPMQQRIFNWMPVFFTFLLASFPAGLVIYWFWNNILSILQQSVIMKRQGVKIPLLENLGVQKLINKYSGKSSSGGS